MQTEARTWIISFLFTTMPLPVAWPEELLDAAVKYIASDTVFLERQTFLLRWKYSVTKLLPLSIVNHQFRRICSPFLFAHIELNGPERNLEKLKDQCIANQAFAKSIR